MNFIVTLVSSQKPLETGHLDRGADSLSRRGIGTACDPVWLDPGKAADLAVSDRPDFAEIGNLRRMLREDRIDVFVTPQSGRRKKLLIADMDSTIVSGETLDELAACAGVGDRVAAITARAMNGELDFRAALRERVGLLRGLPEDRLTETLGRAALNPGAEIFVRSMKKNGAACILVSGGFTFFTKVFAEMAGFDSHHGNLLHIEDGKLTGHVLDPILDKNSKIEFLRRYAADLDLTPDDVLAIGDGANDLPMLLEAGLGIGYHPKPVLEDALDNCIFHGDLTAALYAQGYGSGDFTDPT